MGSFAASVAHDFLVVDDLESVVFVSKALEPSGPDTTLTLTGVDFHEYTAREMVSSDGLFGVGARRVSLPHVQIPAANAPRDGDQVQRTSEGINYRITGPVVLDDFSISYIANLTKEK